MGALAPSGVDYTPLLSDIRQRSLQTGSLLRDTRLLLCLGNRVALTVFAGGGAGSSQVVGAATTESEGLALAAQLAPTLLVVEDRLEEGDGISLVVAIKARWPRLKTVLLVSQMQRHQRIQRAIEAGCEGLVPASRFGQGAGLAVLQTVGAGGIYIDQGLRAALRRQPAGRGPSEPLTRREADVLALVARGRSNRAIGEVLYISADTVKTHLRHVMRKLAARDRTHAAVLGLCWELIDWPDL